MSEAGNGATWRMESMLLDETAGKLHALGICRPQVLGDIGSTSAYWMICLVT